MNAAFQRKSPFTLPLWIVLPLFSLLTACAAGSDTSGEAAAAEVSAYDKASDTLRHAGEKHLRRVTQLTFGGENAEAYWSAAEDALVWQKMIRGGELPCDRIFWSPIDLTNPQPLEGRSVSDGSGRTTCAYFLNDDQQIIYASTRHGGADCPPEPDRSLGYVWPLYDTYEIYVADRNGENRTRLTDNNVYDAEATVSPDGSRVVFTSTRDGDIDLYTMNPDGSDVVRITNELGYDGGAFFSPDGKKLIFRASRMNTDEEAAEYRALLADGLVRPMAMELFVCNVDGSEMRQLTDLGAANWAPYMHPDGKRIIFCSNHLTGSYPFNLFMINLDGSGLEQITFDEAFDSFPMFTRDGKHIVFSSNRNNGGTRDTNVFVAEWVD